MQVIEHKCNRSIMKAVEITGRPESLDSCRAILVCVVCGNTDNPKSCGRCNNSFASRQASKHVGLKTATDQQHMICGASLSATKLV